MKLDGSDLEACCQRRLLGMHASTHHACIEMRGKLWLCAQLRDRADGDAGEVGAAAGSSRVSIGQWRSSAAGSMWLLLIAIMYCQAQLVTVVTASVLPAMLAIDVTWYTWRMGK